MDVAASVEVGLVIGENHLLLAAFAQLIGRPSHGGRKTTCFRILIPPENPIAWSSFLDPEPFWIDPPPSRWMQRETPVLPKELREGRH